VGTRRWVHGLRLRVLRRWRPWRSSTRQVGGWTVDFEEGITFSSVRGAGHMVPYTQPERAFHLFSSWVHEQPL
jgi:serine carboxypeptidase-like clade 2